MNKLFTTFVVSLAMLFSINIAAQPTFSISPQNTDASTGDIITVAVQVTDFTNILTFQYSINFDPNVLEFIDVIDPEVIPDLNFGTNSATNGDLTVSWFDDNLTGVTLPGTVSLYELSFEVLSDVGTDIVFSGSPTPIEVADADENSIGMNSANGTVNGGAPADLIITASNETGQNGDAICVDVEVANFSEISDVAYSMNFDETVLQFDNFTNLNLTDLDLADFDDTDAANGNLTLDWTDMTNGATGSTVTDGTVIYQACFTIIGSSGDMTNFDLTGNPTAISVMSGGNAITPTLNAGSVNVTGGGGGGGSGSGNFTVTAPTITTNPGDNICIDVTVDNFDNILSFQYSMNFDETVLEFDQIIDPEVIPDLNFGTNSATNGDLTVSWFDDNLEGVDVADGTVLYQVCFNVIGQNGDSSPFDFSGNPTIIEVADADENTVPFTGNNGLVNVGMGGGGGGNNTDFTVTAPTITTNPGDNICIDVTVDNFDNILSFQYSMNFDETVLEFDQIIDPEVIPDLNFGTNAANNGNLTVSWFDDNLEGVDVADGTVLYQVCFNVIGQNGDSSPFDFSGNPTIIEVADADENAVPFTGNNGLVNVGMGGGGGNNTDFTVTAPTLNAMPGENVCIDITVENFDNILSFQYSMNFDATILEFDQIIDPEVIPDLNFGTNAANNGNLTVSWFDDNLEGVDVADGTVLYQVCFNVIGQNGDSSPFDFSGNPTIIEVADADENAVPFTGNNGTININSDPNAGSLSLSGTTTSPNPGDNICIDITANNFMNIASFDYNMEFNPAVIAFDQIIDAGNLAGLTFDDSNAGSGIIGISWDNNGVGVTLSNNTLLYQICFNVVGGSGTSSSISFVNANATDADNNSINVGTNDGIVNVQTPTTDFTVTGSSEEVASGETFCIDISIENFTDILSMQYSMNFDPTILQFTEIVDPEVLPDINFGTNDASNGNLTISWFDEDLEGVSIPSPSMIYQVCFTAIGPNNCDVTHLFDFSGNPTIIEVSNADEEPVPFFSNSGEVIIGEDCVPAIPVVFTIEDECGVPGETICVSLTVDNFLDVNSMQYSFCFDCSVLTFIEFTNPNASLEAVGNINTGNPNPCDLSLSWFDEDLDGETLPNGATIIDVCFQINPTAMNNANAAISICNTPTVIEIADENSNLISSNYVSGSICVDDSPCNGPISITNEIVNNVSPCSGDNNGVIDITDAGGNGAGVNSYAWVNTNAPGTVIATTQDLMNVGAGTYQVTITGCMGTETFTQQFSITEPSPISLTADNIVPVGCFGESTGLINTTTSGGTGGYSYTWNPAIATGDDPSSLPAGFYAVTVVDNNGCQQNFGPFEVEQPASALTATTAVTDAACFGETGQIVVNANGGTPNYSYTLTPGGTQTNPNFTGLSTGAYTLVVTDANACSESFSNLVVSSPDQIVVSLANTIDDSGVCDGSINVNVSGGNPNALNYSWTGPDNYTATTQDIADLCGGEYCLTVTDIVGNCMQEFCTTVEAPLSLNEVQGSQKDACFGICNGEVEIEIVGGDGPYTAVWTPDGQTGTTVNTLCPGENILTVESADGQMATIAVQIGEATSSVLINNAVTTDPSSSAACDGAIDLTVSGGFGGPYSYTWNPAQSPSTGNLTNLCEGTYDVTVTDVNGCEINAQYTLIVGELTITNPTSTAVACFGDANGSLQFDVSGGNPGYTVVVTDGAGNPQTAASTNPYVYNDLAAGVYLVSVTDMSNTVEMTTIEVTTPGQIEQAVQKIVDATASTTGSITLEQTVGGMPPYQYMWSGGPTPNVMNPTGLTPGSYSLTITDAADCFMSFPNIVTIYEIGIENADLSNPPCSSNPTGNITITTSSDANNLPFSYAWEDGNGQAVGTNSPVLDAVLEGTYTVTVTDACGTSFMGTYVLAAESELDLDLVALSEFNGFNVLCNGDENGSIQADATSGVQPFIFEWSNSATGPVVSNLGAGEYTVTVSDANQCTAVSSIILTEPDLITSNFSIDSISCNGLEDGRVIANVEGGVVLGDYDYFWSNGDDDNILGPVGSGTFTLDVVDGNDCEEEFSITLLEPTVLTAEFVMTPVTANSLGSIQINAMGGTPPYTYQWPGGVDAEALAENLEIGFYPVLITDANGCQFMDFIDNPIQVRLDTECFKATPVITPNDDGSNENLIITCNERVMNLEIYNRWGQLVYEAESYFNDWNGVTRRGNTVPEGTYYYVYEYLDVNTNQTEQIRKYVTVLRD